MANYEPCSICEEYIEGVICNKEKCPVGIMKKELDRLHKLQKPTATSGYRIENGKIVFYTSILNGYRHEYANAEEVVNDLNIMLQNAYKNDEIYLHYKGKLQTAKSEAIKEFAERLKDDCYIPYTSWTNERVVDESDLDNLVKELTEKGGVDNA